MKRRRFLSIILSIFMMTILIRTIFAQSSTNAQMGGPTQWDSEIIKEWEKQVGNSFAIDPDNLFNDDAFAIANPSLFQDLRGWEYFKDNPVITPEDLFRNANPPSTLPQAPPPALQLNSSLPSNTAPKTVDISSIQNQIAENVGKMRKFLSKALPTLSLADIPWAQEGIGLLTISGGTEDDQFLAEPCFGNCPQIELGPPLIGRRWITGVQKVRGGKGWLKFVNGGKEPTGIKPWPEEVPMKLVIASVNENLGQINLAWYFQIRVKWFNKTAATPHFIGPFPAGIVKEGGIILAALNAPPVPSLSNFSDIGNLFRRFQGSPPSGGLDPTRIDGCDSYRQVNLGALALSLNSEPYDQVLRGTGGRVLGLGRYSFLVNNRAMDEVFRTIPGGTEWLTRVRGGYRPTAREVQFYFPPGSQNYLINRTLTENLAAAAVTGAAEGGQQILTAVQMLATGRDNPNLFTPESQGYARSVLTRYQNGLPKVQAACRVAALR
jgi:hypothetical protein